MKPCSRAGWAPSQWLVMACDIGNWKSHLGHDDLQHKGWTQAGDELDSSTAERVFQAMLGHAGSIIGLQAIMQIISQSLYGLPPASTPPVWLELPI